MGRETSKRNACSGPPDPVGQAITKRNACSDAPDLFLPGSERVKWQFSVGRSPLIYPIAGRPHSAERRGGSQSLGRDSSPLRSAHACDVTEIAALGENREPLSMCTGALPCTTGKQFCRRIRFLSVDVTTKTIRSKYALSVICEAKEKVDDGYRKIIQ